MSSRRLDTGVDTAGFLAGLLTGYEPTAILREQAQNADDACSKGSIPGWLRISFQPDLLIIENPSILSDEDWQRLAKTSSRGKAKDPEQTGEFGVGFWSVLHLTDAPAITSGKFTATIDQLSGAETELRELSEPLAGTRFELRLRRSPTEASTQLEVQPVTPTLLDDLEQSFERQIPELLLFAKSLTCIELRLRDGSAVVGERRTVGAAGAVETVTITVSTGRGTAKTTALCVHGQVPDPPEGRSGDLTVAFPAASSALAGRIFCTFPTETATGLPFSINAHYYAAMDRRSIAHAGPNGDWNDRIFKEAGRLVGSNLEVLFAVRGPEYRERLRWFVPRHGTVSEISRRRDICLEAIDNRAVDAAVIRDRTGVARRGRELILLDAVADRLLGAEVGESVKRPGESDLIDLYRRWGIREWRPNDVARWIARNAPACGTDLEAAPGFMSTVSSLKELLDYCAQVRAELGTACLALGTDDRLYPLGARDLPKPAGVIGRLAEGLGKPVVHPELRDTVAWDQAPDTGIEWFRSALISAAAKLVGKVAQISSIECFRSLSTVGEALNVFADAGQTLEGLPLAVDTDRKIQTFDSSVVVGLPPGPHRPAAERLLVRLGKRPLHDKVDDPRLAGGDIRRMTHHVLVDAVRTSRAWDSVVDTADLLATCSILVDAQIAGRRELQPLALLAIWPVASGATMPLGDLCIPAPDRVVRPDQKDRLLSPELCNPRSESGRLSRRVLEDVFDRVQLDAAEEAVVALEHPPTDPTELYSAIDDLVHHWPSLHATQKARLQAAPFVPCADQLLRRPADVLVTREALPLGLGRRQLVGPYREDRRLTEILLELRARRTPTIEELIQVATEISTEVVTRDDDPAHLLWKFLDFNLDSYRERDLAQLGRIAWLPSDPDNVRRRPVDLVVPTLAFAQLLFPVPVGVGNPGVRLRDGLGIRATLTVDDLVALAEAAAERESRLADQYFVTLEQRAASDSEARRLGPLRNLRFLPVANELRAPQELVSPRAGEIWGHLKTPIDQMFVAKYPHLSEIWGISDGEDPDWRDHLDVLSVLADQAELSTEDVRLARRRMIAVASALAAGDVSAENLKNRHCILTTDYRILRPFEALRPDVPTSVLKHIGPKVPAADVTSTEIRSFIDGLSLASLRDAVYLEPIVERTSQEATWRERLAIHEANILRFLRHAGVELPDEWVHSWPPIVEGVRSLRVRAFYRVKQIAEWEDSCFLSERNGVLTLSIKGATTTERSIVDAIAGLYGIRAGHKTLLVQVLQGETEAEGAEALDYDEIPQLPSDDPWVNAKPLPLDMDLTGEPTDPGSGVVEVTSRGDDHPQRSAGAGRTEFLETEGPFEFRTETESDLDTRRGRREWPDQSTLDPATVSELRTQDHSRDLGESAIQTDHLIAGSGLSAAGATPARLQPARVRTDWRALADNYDVVEICGPPVDEIDLGQENQHDADDGARRRKCVLSFYDWDNGLLPLRSRDIRALAGPGGVQFVTIFGREYEARQVNDRSVEIVGGRELYLEHEIVPGTVIHLRAGLPGRIELHINEDPHEVTDVWILEMDDRGELHRERLESVTVRWETDGPLYRCERRWEDLAALHAEARESALDLIIKVFEVFGHDGLTLNEVWSLVALNRLFALTTINNHLYSQDGLFTNENGIWWKTGETVKRYRASGSKEAGTKRADVMRSAQASDSEILRVARQLRDLLRDSSDELRNQVGQVLGLRVVAMSDEREFELAVTQLVERPDASLLAAIRRDLSQRPELSTVAVSVLEGASVIDPVATSALLDLIEEFGVAGAVSRAKDLRPQLLMPVEVDEDTTDVVRRAELACDRASKSRLTWAVAQQMVSEAYRNCCSAPYDNPAQALDEVIRLERLLRRYDALATASVNEERSLCIARVDSEVGDTDAHGDVDRQALLATIRVLGGDATSTLDALNEYAKLLKRIPGRTDDGSMMFKIAEMFAAGSHLKNAAALFAKKQSASGTHQHSTMSDHTRDFINLWCEMANLRSPLK